MKPETRITMSSNDFAKLHDPATFTATREALALAVTMLRHIQNGGSYTATQYVNNVYRIEAALKLIS